MSSSITISRSCRANISVVPRITEAAQPWFDSRCTTVTAFPQSDRRVLCYVNSNSRAARTPCDARSHGGHAAPIAKNPVGLGKPERLCDSGERRPSIAPKHSKFGCESCRSCSMKFLIDILGVARTKVSHWDNRHFAAGAGQFFSPPSHSDAPCGARWPRDVGKYRDAHGKHCTGWTLPMALQASPS